jgi:hypothetical protein
MKHPICAPFGHVLGAYSHLKTALFYPKAIAVITVAITVAAILRPLPVKAELPPGSYDSLRMNATDALVIKVISVKQKPLPDNALRTIEVSLKARILEIERTKMGLKKGNYIIIRYPVLDSTQPPIPGPRPIPVLEQGGVYPAFLNQQPDGTYAPAAYGESFRMTPEG